MFYIHTKSSLNNESIFEKNLRSDAFKNPTPVSLCPLFLSAELNNSFLMHFKQLGVFLQQLF